MPKGGGAQQGFGDGSRRRGNWRRSDIARSAPRGQKADRGRRGGEPAHPRTLEGSARAQRRRQSWKPGTTPPGFLFRKHRSHARSSRLRGGRLPLYRRRSSSRSILVRMLDIASSTDVARISNAGFRISGRSGCLGRTATRQARPSRSALMRYPLYSV
jgi:hypothetical protein